MLNVAKDTTRYLAFDRIFILNYQLNIKCL